MLEFVGGDLKAEVRRLEKQARKQAAGARGQQEQPQQQDPGVPAPGGEQGQGCAPAGTEAAVAAAAGPAGDDGGAEADVEDDGDRDSGEPEQRPAKRRRKGPKGEKVKMQLGNIRSRVLCKRKGDARASAGRAFPYTLVQHSLWRKWLTGLQCNNTALVDIQH